MLSVTHYFLMTLIMAQSIDIVQISIFTTWLYTSW